MEAIIEIVRDFDNTYYANITIGNEPVSGLPTYVDYTTLKKAVLAVVGIPMPNVSALTFQKIGRKKYATVHLPLARNAEASASAPDSDEDILAKLNKRFPGQDNYGQPKEKYFSKVLAMTPMQLLKEAKQMIWLSAYANNNTGSDFHWQVDSICDICSARNQGRLYDWAYKAVVYETTGRMS